MRSRPDQPAGVVAAAFAQRLLAVIANRSVRSVAMECPVNHQTIHAILAGEVWPDMYTIASLEAGLRTSLWPAMPAMLRGPDDVRGSVYLGLENSIQKTPTRLSGAQAGRGRNVCGRTIRP